MQQRQTEAMKSVVLLQDAAHIVEQRVVARTDRDDLAHVGKFRQGFRRQVLTSSFVVPNAHAGPAPGRRGPPVCWRQYGTAARSAELTYQCAVDATVHLRQVTSCLGSGRRG